MSTHAPGLEAESLTFVALADGTIVVDGEIPDGAAIPLAEAVESQLAAPYEAAAVHADGDVWSVAAHSVLIASAEGPAETVELSRVDGQVSAMIDGRGVAAALVPKELRALLDDEAGDVAITGERLDDATWVLERWAL